jgi:transcriptional regulator with XRE-family HTH domain
MNDITNRFIEIYAYLLEQKKVSNPSHFAKMIDISTSMINEILKGRSNAGINPIQNTVKKFTEVNSEWLLTGSGNKLKNEFENNLKLDSSAEKNKEIARLKDKINDLQTINELLTRTVADLDNRNSTVKYIDREHTLFANVAEPESELKKEPKNK